jgi:FkbM family methyltransferase
MIFSVKYYIRKLTGLFPYIHYETKNIKYPLKLRNGTVDIGVCKLVLVNREYDVQANKLPQIILDAGANIGCASIWFANKYPDAKIISIEAQQENFELLKENVFPYKNIIPIHAAIWNESGIFLDIELEDGKYQDGFTVKETNKNGSVKSITIDKIMQDFNLERIDILKMDIEGAEKEVFEKPEKWINKVGTILIELHERKKKGCLKNFYAVINEMNFNIWNQGELKCVSRSIE